MDMYICSYVIMTVSEASQNSSEEKPWQKNFGRNHDCVEGVGDFDAHSSGRRVDDKENHN